MEHSIFVCRAAFRNKNIRVSFFFCWKGQMVEERPQNNNLKHACFLQKQLTKIPILRVLLRADRKIHFVIFSPLHQHLEQLNIYTQTTLRWNIQCYSASRRPVICTHQTEKRTRDNQIEHVRVKSILLLIFIQWLSLNVFASEQPESAGTQAITVQLIIDILLFFN